MAVPALPVVVAYNTFSTVERFCVSSEFSVKALLISEPTVRAVPRGPRNLLAVDKTEEALDAVPATLDAVPATLVARSFASLICARSLAAKMPDFIEPPIPIARSDTDKLESVKLVLNFSVASIA